MSLTGESTQESVIVRFLDNYRTYGSFGHLWAAQSFQEAIGTADDIKRRQLLTVKIYGEFVSAIEDLGALCVAIKHRNDELGLIYAYLTYGQGRNPNAPKTRLPEILRLMEDGDGLTSALALPSLADILSRNPALSNTILPDLYQQTNTVLAVASKSYSASDGLLVRAYNKVKHGFVVVDDLSLFGDHPEPSEKNETWIIVDNPVFSKKNPPEDSTLLEPVAVDLADIGPMVDRIATIRGAVEVLCRLVIHLLQEGAINATHHD